MFYGPRMVERPARRSSAFSPLEKDFLKSQIAFHKSIIDNKNTDSATIQLKCKAWNKITEEFNSIPEHRHRTDKQLKKFWDNLKTEMKKELSGSKKEVLGTVGAPTIEILKYEDIIDQSPDKPDVLTNEVEERLLSPLIEEVGTVLLDNRNAFQGARVVHRREMIARARRVEAQIKHDESIHSLLLMEAKYKALAAQEVYNEKRLQAQKTEVDLQIRKLELEKILKNNAE